MYDVCIIGGGVIGCAIARELSKYALAIGVLEKEDDVGAGTTKANSGIVHGGYDEEHGTLKGKFSAWGNSLFPTLDAELRFGFKKIGSFVVGFGAADEEVIQKLYDNGIQNGVRGLRVVDGDYVRRKESHVHPDVAVALYCESAGIASPYGLAIALAENAIENGVKLHLNAEVLGITPLKDHFRIHAANQFIQAKYIINAAGLYSDRIARMVGLEDFEIKPRQGQYALLDKDQGYLVNSVIFQTPSEKGKGVLVTQTYHGNLLIGPSSEYIVDKDDLDTTKDTMECVINLARKSLPGFDMRKVITAFSGNRAVVDTHDFIIAESKVKRFINVAGIASPGLTAAPAIAIYVVDLLKDVGLSCKRKSDFNPRRRPYHHVADMAHADLNAIIQKDPSYGHIVCRCETISEGEILDALSRPIPIHSLDALKRRVRPGMGRCQGGFCTPRLMEILQNKCQMSMETLTKKGKGSYIVAGRTK